MNIRNTIIKHYKKFFDLHAKGIALTEDDHLDIDWAESLVKDCFIPDVSNSAFICHDGTETIIVNAYDIEEAIKILEANGYPATTKIQYKPYKALHCG